MLDTSHSQHSQINLRSGKGAELPDVRTFNENIFEMADKTPIKLYAIYLPKIIFQILRVIKKAFEMKKSQHLRRYYPKFY